MQLRLCLFKDKKGLTSNSSFIMNHFESSVSFVKALAAVLRGVVGGSVAGLSVAGVEAARDDGRDIALSSVFIRDV